jgi:predicted secreted protein
MIWIVGFTLYCIFIDYFWFILIDAQSPPVALLALRENLRVARPSLPENRMRARLLEDVIDDRDDRLSITIIAIIVVVTSSRE